MKNHNKFDTFLSDEFSIKFAQTQKTFFIYNLKIASRFLESHGLPSIHFNLDGDDCSITNVSTSDPKFEEYVKTIYSDWDDILSGNSKKDLVIVYRNPMERLATAIVQDSYFFTTNSNSSTYIYPLLSNIGYSSTDIDKLVHGDDDDVVEDMTRDLIQIYFNSFVNNLNIEDTHYNSHLLPLVKIITTTNIDRNKLIMVDLDLQPNDLEKIMISNDLTPKENSDEKSPNRNDRKQYVFELISNMKAKYILKDKIKGELFSYNILKSIHKSILK